MRGRAWNSSRLVGRQIHQRSCCAASRGRMPASASMQCLHQNGLQCRSGGSGGRGEERPAQAGWTGAGQRLAWVAVGWLVGEPHPQLHSTLITWTDRMRRSRVARYLHTLVIAGMRGDRRLVGGTRGMPGHGGGTEAAPTTRQPAHFARHGAAAGAGVCRCRRCGRGAGVAHFW